MNHWGVGHIDNLYRVTIPEPVLRPISINVGAMVWGMFYPISQTDEEYEMRPELDFVFSPIPYDIWPKTGRCTVRIHHIPEAFERVTEALLDCNASIIISDASRSAHSYDTWRLIISCDNIEIKDEYYIRKKRQYKGMNSELTKVKKVIENKCKDILFRDPCDITKVDPVTCAPHNAMAFFYAMSRDLNLIKNVGIYNKWTICKPFMMKRSSDGNLIPHNGGFKGILDDLTNQEDNDFALPSYCFAESQSDDMNMRLVVIPKKRERNFYKLIVHFQRAGGPITSKGVVNFVLNRICEDAKVWAINNKTMMFEDIHEDGEAEFLIEGQGEEEIMRRTTKLQEKINKKEIINELKNIKEVTINCENLSRAFIYQNIDREEGITMHNNIFFSYSSADSKEAIELSNFLQQQGISCFLSEKGNGKAKIPLGCDYREYIKDQIVSSKIIMLICSPNSINSKWVMKELGAAWALNKTIVPIALNMPITEISEDIIYHTQSESYHKAINNIEFAKDIKKLIDRIK